MPTLKDLRGAAGLSQMELANASGVSLETIKKIETGRVERPHPATLRLLAAVLGQVPVVMNGSRGGPVFDRDRFQNSWHSEAACLRLTQTQTEGFVPLRHTLLRGRICGPLASLTLTQTFGYTRMECDRVLEAVYRFPLPGDAAVTSVKVTFGDVVVRTRLAERSEAEREYAAAREQGRQAALATRESADVFSLQVTGLQPDQEVTVESSFVVAAQPSGPGWQLRIPLTIGPRYSRGDEAGTPASRGQPLQVWADPRHRFGVDLQVVGAEQVSSSSHRLSMDGERVALRDREVIPDRDFLLEWEPRYSEHSTSLSVLTHEDLDEGMRYFLALVTPPGGDMPTLDREVLLLVDHSGSMQGPKWEACRWAVRRFLTGMRSTEYFNLGLFESSCDWLAQRALPASDANRQRALEFLDAHQPRGGTELGVALEQALRSPAAPGERARHVLIVTDAQVSDEGRILQLVENQGLVRRVSVISIDSSPRSDFVRSLAESAGGEAVFLSSDPHDEDITSALDRVLDTWGRPVARDVALIAQTGTGKTTRSRIDLGDLPAGRSLWVSGAVSLYAEPVLRLQSGSTVLAQQVIDLERPAEYEEVRTLFGARQIGRLERLDSQRLDADARDAILDELGYANDPLRVARPRPVYAENAAVEGSVVHRLLVRESLRFGLVCSATAFVGERIEAGRRVDARVLVPSALPHGWLAHMAMAMPSVAADASMPMPTRAPTPMRVRQPKFTYAGESMRLGPPPGPPAVYVPPFRGIPSAEQDEVVLIEGIVGRDVGLQLSRLRVKVQKPDALDASLEAWVCAGEVVVRVNLAETVRLGGERPLNVAIPGGTIVKVILKGRWPAEAGELSIELS